MNSPEAIAARPKVPATLYQPICDWQTRLLKLLPLFDNSEYSKSKVQCSLHIVDLVCIEGVVITGTKQQITYEALSYSWGRDVPSHSIRCNDQECVVSKQLEEALRALCYIDGPRWIWCDAFCIDQSNINEKSKQVQKMQIIFGKARQVIVWLGPHLVTSRISQPLARWRYRSQQGDTNREDLRIDREEIARALSACPWLTRTWVRQEIQAARQIVIPSSYPDVLTWENLTAISEEAYNVAAPEPTSNRVSSEYRQARVLSKDFILHPFTLLYYINSPRRRPILLRNAQHHHLAEWIASMAPFETTEPVDRVYGILGLFEPSLRSGHPNDISSLKADYGLPIGEVYTEVMKRILLQSQNLAWLEAHVFSPSTENKRQLPSWVFNWEAPSFEVIVTRQSQAYWRVSSTLARQARLLEVEIDWNNFGTVEGDARVHTRCTWTVSGAYYRTIYKVQPADYETRETSFLPPAVFDLGLWRVATYTHSSTEMFKSGFESVFRNFYVVSWAQPGDVIVELGTSLAYFLLRPVTAGHKEYFLYLGKAMAKIPTQMMSRSGQVFRDWYRHEREFVLI